MALISLFRQQWLDLESYTEHISSAAECNRIARRVMQKMLFNARFQPEGSRRGQERFMNEKGCRSITEAATDCERSKKNILLTNGFQI